MATKMQQAPRTRRLGPPEPESRIVLPNVSWNECESLVKLWEGRHIRLTYDRGQLELLTTSCEHERFKTISGTILTFLAFALDRGMISAGEMTFRKRFRERGLEPDDCDWISNHRRMLGKRDYEHDVDPPPDLVLDIELTSGALNKMSIYAGLGFPEVWRFDGETLRIHRIGDAENISSSRPVTISRRFLSVS
ncbi:MAG: hypothetical protein JWN86_4176 [Planctomycetota bacterium]|nr:hypothetical protein [Planctomycetota bacterium]